MCASFEHQFAGFRDEHEEADDFRVRDGEWSASRQLLAEERNDRAVGAEHVSEAGGDKLRDALDFALFDGFVEALHIDFADAFGAAHHVGWVDRLIFSNYIKYSSTDATYILLTNFKYHLSRLVLKFINFV